RSEVFSPFQTVRGNGVEPTSQEICPALLHLNHLKNPLTGICYAHSRRRANASSNAVSFVDEPFI
ncbi:hypothetical protein, partial [Stutzerimonas stutzeri]|uniref:hypothetical protein n=1 Tax=Stutzerimonas stutzeri TaxID=316 RepID=UPI003CFDC24E